jgi:histidinol-phosphate aminotransferase
MPKGRKDRTRIMAKTQAAALPTLNPHLAKIVPYPPGKPIEEVKREFGLDSVIKLASNENPLGPSPKALKAMAAYAGEMNLYPDGFAFALRQAVAARLGVKPEELVFGAGSDEVVTLLAQAYLNPGNEMLTSNYSFVRYQMAAQQVGAACRLIPMQDMRHDLKAIAAAVTGKTAMICLDLPGNPTGSIVTRRELTSFLGAIPSRVIVVLDQAYFEFACDDPNFPDGLTLRKKFPNLVVTRTFSKVYGLAGLRIGYGVARREIVDGCERVRSPFNTNRLAQYAALAALEDAAHLKKSVALNAKGIAQYQKGFKALGLASWPTWANFILVDLGEGREGKMIFNQMLKLGVVTRPMGGYGLNRCLRISIGTTAENRRCLAVLKQVLEA